MKEISWRSQSRPNKARMAAITSVSVFHAPLYFRSSSRSTLPPPWWGCRRLNVASCQETMNAVDDDWLERIWAHREEVIYPSLFGAKSEGIFPIPVEQGGDPRWSTCGVFRFAPTEKRKSWLYVSSGLSNAWFDETPDPSGTSGFGCEFIMETPEKADWPIIRLHQIMKYQIDICCGKHGGADPLSDNDRIPLGGAIDFMDSSLTHLILAQPPSIAQGFQQGSGSADFYLMFGITEVERDFAKRSGGNVFLDALRAETEFPITNPTRNSIKA